MIGALRQVASLAAAGAVTWWLLVYAPAPAGLAGAAPAAPAPRVTVELARAVAAAQAPDVEPAADPSPAEPEPDVEHEAEPEPPAADPEPEPDPVPVPPAEAGARDGEEDGERTADAAAAQENPPEPSAETGRPDAAAARAAEVAALQQDEALLDEAREELEGEVRRGFSTVFLSDPADQLAIARAFGEEVVLVPRAALDPEASGVQSYALDLGTGRVRTLEGRPPLERFRQYRDLLAYEYARLPAPLRELRARVVRRDEVFLFAALIPPSEWALVVGRRRQALARHGIEEDEVERFVLRYVALPGGAFDLEVARLELTDGRSLPGPR